MPGEAARVAADIGGPVFVKAQVLVGGRGKAGGIRKADNPDEASAAAADILATPIRDEAADGLLVEAALDVSREIYLGITVSAEAGCPGFKIAAVHVSSAAKLSRTTTLPPSVSKLCFATRSIVSRRSGTSLQPATKSEATTGSTASRQRVAPHICGRRNRPFVAAITRFPLSMSQR